MFMNISAGKTGFCVSNVPEKYYGVEIDYTSEVKGISCSGKLELKNDLKEVLESLTKTAPIRYESVDNKIKVMKKEKESMK